MRHVGNKITTHCFGFLEVCHVLRKQEQLINTKRKDLNCDAEFIGKPHSFKREGTLKSTGGKIVHKLGISHQIADVL